MQAKNFKFFNIIFLLVIGSVIISCSLERKLAKSYVKKEKQPSVLLFFPEELIKSNLKTELLMATDSLKHLNQDSIIEANDLYLHLINDSVFINLCKESLITELKAYGMKVYGLDQIDELIEKPDTTYVLSLVQMQVEEYIFKEKTEGFVVGRYYTHDFDLNAINLNAWFELGQSKITKDQFPVLYSSYYLFDDLEVNFLEPEFYGEPVNLVYRIDSMDMTDVYNLAELAGKKYAINFYDYLLNIYVQDQLPIGQVPAFYYHYDRRGKNIQIYYNDAFTEIDP